MQSWEGSVCTLRGVIVGASHIFCRTYHGDSEMGYRVNLGCVIGLDVLALEIGVIDGRSMPVTDQ